jgi:signal transduction histidine kinase
LSVDRTAVTITEVSTAPATTPSGLPGTPAATVWAAAGAAVLAAAAALLVQAPLLLVDPVPVTVTAAVAAATVALGVHLALGGERLAGTAFAAGGLLWTLHALEALVPWGASVAWTTGGLPVVALGVGIIGYHRERPRDAVERAFPVVALLLTTGARIAVMPFVDATALGAQPGAWWPAPWAGVLPQAAALGICRACLVVLAVHIGVLGLRILRGASGPRRQRLRPVLVPALLLVAAIGCLNVVGLVVRGEQSWRNGVVVAGVLVLVFTAGVPLAVAARRRFGSRAARRLPRARTPETVTAYVRRLTDDPTAEMLYWSPDGGLLDGAGRRRNLAEETRPGRFWAWVLGADGGRVGLLTAAPALWGDPETVQELVRGVAVIAESAAPSVLLRRRVAQLTALRVAEELAFTEARERFRRDLHDGLHQTIAAARMDLDGLHDVALGDAEAVVAGLEAKMVTALAQVQSLGQGSAPPELDSALAAAIEGAATRLRLPARVTVTGDRLGVLAMPAYFLVREALTNVVKHARAGSVEVGVRSDGRAVEIVVSDDGRGGAAEGPEGGIGDMRRRVEELGGSLTLDSPPGHGTTLRASIPCV